MRLRHAPLILLASLPLLVAEDCGPVPPEQDPVLLGHPEVIARLEADHGPAISMLREYLERSDEDRVAFRIRGDTFAFEEIDALRASIPRLERVVAVEYRQDGSPDDPWCGEGAETTRFELDLVTRGILGGLQPRVAVFELCRTEDAGPDSIRSDVGELYIRDEAWVARVLRRAEAEAVRQVNRYQIDRAMARQQIQGELLGCPAGTLHEREGDTHFCASDGVKHGPWVKGDLTDTLVGPRLVEGAYHNGAMHGLWTQFDSEGRALSSTEWQLVERLVWGGGF